MLSFGSYWTTIRNSNKNYYELFFARFPLHVFNAKVNISAPAPIWDYRIGYVLNRA